MYPFERFTEDAKRTLTLAQEEAERFHHSYIGTEHLLLGLLRVEKGTAFRVLTELGVDIATVREVIKGVIGRNERIMIQQIIPTSRVKKVIELSFEEARRLGHNEVDTGDVLLGLIIEGEGIAAHVLSDLGATLEKVRVALERQLGPSRIERSRPGIHPPRFPGLTQSELGPATGRIDAPPIHSTDASDLLRLLRAPAIAKLLKARGVDTRALSTQLGEPPSKVLELRGRLAVASHALRSSVDIQDFELAAKLRDEIADLSAQLATAEEEWLDSLA
jgi:Clp amino terminal domain, pathogenicity island component/UvrB/uvrC motif